MFGGLFKAKKGEAARAEQPETAPPAAPAEGTGDTPEFVVPERTGPVTPEALALDGAAEEPVEKPAETAEAQPDSMFDFSPPSAGSDAGDGGEDGGSLAELFSSDDSAEEDSNLGSILEMAPYATVDDIMESLIEIKEMLRGRLEQQQ